MPGSRAPPAAACYRWHAPQRALQPAVPRPAPPPPSRPPGCGLRLRAAGLEGAPDRLDDDADVLMPPASDPLACDVGRPELRYQAALPLRERKVHRATAEGLAKENRLVKFQLGAQGFSASFLTGCIDALLKHEVIRVKLGGFTKQELGAAAELLEGALDCLVVHQIGHTLTLFRQAGLARPSNLPPLASALPEQFEYDEDKFRRGGGEAEGGAEAAKQQKLQKKRDKAAQDSAAARKLPPQFQVL
jgi:RNA-binding protein YhbY